MFDDEYDILFENTDIKKVPELTNKEYNLSTIKSMVEKQKSKFGWEFVFMSANIDAISVASTMGIDASRAANYHADGVGTATNFMAVGKMFTKVKNGGNLRGFLRFFVIRLLFSPQYTVYRFLSHIFPHSFPPACG